MTTSLATRGALRGLADGLADLVAHRLVALPLTLGVAVVAVAFSGRSVAAGSLAAHVGGQGQAQKGKEHGGRESSHGWVSVLCQCVSIVLWVCGESSRRVSDSDS